MGEELLESMQKGAAWFDLSTNSPTLIRRLYRVFAEKGIYVSDAPVSGVKNASTSVTTSASFVWRYVRRRPSAAIPTV